LVLPREYLGRQLVPGAFRSMLMAAIRYQVPYQVTVVARDAGSGKSVTNSFYFRCGPQVTSTPAYGGVILGPSSTATFLANFRTAFAAVLARLNANYRTIEYNTVSLLGKRFSSPLFPILAEVNGPPVAISTPFPHGFVTGQSVIVAGVTTPPGVNGNWVITVISPTAFQLIGAIAAGAWSGDGTVQRIAGSVEFLAADKEVLVGVDAGLVAGDALPLFATSSVRRLNAGVGRQFRSRFSLSPMSEADGVDGAFTGTQQALMVTALTNFMVPVANGGSDATSGLMYHSAVSRRAAFALSSPFVESYLWCVTLASMVQQPNQGSLVRRKPRRTATIV
jgi:hypothetical protein